MVSAPECSQCLYSLQQAEADLQGCSQPGDLILQISSDAGMSRNTSFQRTHSMQSAASSEFHPDGQGHITPDANRVNSMLIDSSDVHVRNLTPLDHYLYTPEGWAVSIPYCRRFWAAAVLSGGRVFRLGAIWMAESRLDGRVSAIGHEEPVDAGGGQSDAPRRAAAVARLPDELPALLQPHSKCRGAIFERAVQHLCSVTEVAFYTFPRLHGWSLTFYARTQSLEYNIYGLKLDVCLCCLHKSPEWADICSRACGRTGVCGACGVLRTRLSWTCTTPNAQPSDAANGMMPSPNSGAPHSLCRRPLFLERCKRVKAIFVLLSSVSRPFKPPYCRLAIRGFETMLYVMHVFSSWEQLEVDSLA